MVIVRQAFCAVIIVMSVAGCSTGSDGLVSFIGEAEFSADTGLKGDFSNVLVTWLEPAGGSQHSGDSGIAGEDLLPVVVDRDETRIFAMEDVDGRPNTMQVLNSDGVIVAETGVGLAPAMVRLTAGNYTVVIRRAAGVSVDDQMALVMPLERIVDEDSQILRSKRLSDGEQSGDTDISPVSYGINPDIVDAVSQVNVKVLGDAPAMALGALYQSMAQALSDAAHNATSGQQQAWAEAQASITQDLTELYFIESTAITTGTVTW